MMAAVVGVLIAAALSALMPRRVLVPLAWTGSTAVAMGRLKFETYTTFSSYSLSIIPMFLLMGQFATLSGMSTSLFKAAEGRLGHRKGGVAMASVGACAGFGAICGSSLATAATMSRVALPELKRYGYSGGFSTATLAAGAQFMDLAGDGQPDLVVLGTGPCQRFPPPSLYYSLPAAGIGLEIMNLPAACRTYNVLVAEGRRVAAALLFD